MPPTSMHRRIIDSAAVLFAMNGYERTRLTEVARTAGVSRSRLYDLFPSKEALLVAMNDQLIEESIKLASDKLAEDLPADEALENWFRAVFELDQSHINLLRIMCSDEVQPSLLINREAINRSLARAGGSVKKVLQRGVKNGVFNPDLAIPRTARALQTMHYFLIRQVSTHNPLMEISAAEQDTIISLMLAGLQTR